MYKYEIAWEESYSTQVQYIFAQACIDYTEIIGNKINEYITIKRNNVIHNYYDQISMKQILKEHPRFFLTKKNLKDYNKIYNQFLKEYKLREKKILSLNLNNLSNKELFKIYEEEFNFLIKVAAYYRSSRPEADFLISKLLKNKLLEYNIKSLEEFNAITLPKKKGLIQKEKLEWQKILSKEKIKKKDLLNYFKKFPSFYLGSWNYESIIKYLYSRYETEKTKQYLEKKEKYKLEDLYKKCKYDKEILYYSKVIQDINFLRFEIKNIWLGVEFRLLPFFKEICNRIGISLDVFFNYYFFDDIKNSLLFNNKISNLEQRKKAIGIIVLNNNKKFIYGEDALNILKNISSKNEKINQIKGDIACEGHVVGRAKVIYGFNINKVNLMKNTFNKGDILITSHTQPSMVPLMKNASAMVADIGGITSHTAVIAREYNIPCIIGTKKATKIIKDGDLIEVDAYKGIIKILK